MDNPVRVSLDQFYGIEINDFAVSVAKTALWITEEQMLRKTQEILPHYDFDFLPLRSLANLVEGNALTTDWGGYSQKTLPTSWATRRSSGRETWTRARRRKSRLSREA